MQPRLQANKVQRFELHSHLCVTAQTTTNTYFCINFDTLQKVTEFFLIIFKRKIIL